MPSRRWFTAGLIAALTGAVACSQEATGPGSSPTPPGSGGTPGSPGQDGAGQQPSGPALEISTPGGAQQALPSDPITVKLTGAELASVGVASTGGRAASGSLSGQVWKPAQPLAFDTDYVLTATTSDSKTLTKQFRTVARGITAGFKVLYLYDDLGVGMPLYVKFDSAVPQEARAEIERRAVATTTPVQEGSWGWLSSTELLYRPKTYWKPGTKIQLDLRWAGVRVGTRMLTKQVAANATISNVARVIKVNSATHTMTVVENGKTVRSMPITTGKAGFVTRSGTKIVLEKNAARRMASETIGINSGSDFYDLNVKWAMRVTWTGEFIHAAPWSVGSQGKANVSHGCVGMSTGNAGWLFSRTNVGDVVEFSGTSRKMQPDEGIGVWLYDWASWKKRSAL